MRKDQFIDKHKYLNIDQAELERKWRVLQELQEQAEFQKMWEAQILSTNAVQATVGGGGGGGDAAATPFGFVNVTDFGGPGGFPNQNLVRLYSDGSKVLLDNQPLIFDESTFPAFSEKTHDGFVYVACPDAIIFRFFRWNVATGEVIQLTQLLSDEVFPRGSMSLHWDTDSESFLYLDNWYYMDPSATTGLYRITLVGELDYSVEQLNAYPSMEANYDKSPVAIFYGNTALSAGAKTISYNVVETDPFPINSTIGVETGALTGAGVGCTLEFDTNGVGVIIAVRVLDHGTNFQVGDQIYCTAADAGIPGASDPTFTIDEIEDVKQPYMVSQEITGDPEFAIIQSLIQTIDPYTFNVSDDNYQLELIDHPYPAAKILWTLGTTQYNGELYFNLYCEQLGPGGWPEDQGAPFFCVAKWNPANPHQLEYKHGYMWDDFYSIYLGLFPA